MGKIEGSADSREQKPVHGGPRVEAFPPAQRAPSAGRGEHGAVLREEAQEGPELQARARPDAHEVRVLLALQHLRPESGGRAQECLKQSSVTHAATLFEHHLGKRFTW